MILNVYTLTLIFGSLLTLVLLFVGCGSLFFLNKKSTDRDYAANKTTAENKSYLVFLLVAAALICRGLNWPLFYLMLQSFIPDVPGAMCIYGTTQVEPVLIRFLEILKPISFFFIGAWFIVYWLDRSTKGSNLAERNFLFFGVVCLLAGVDAIGDITLALTYTPPGIPVSCCTMIGDIQIPIARIKTPAILGTQNGELGMVLYHGFHIIAVGIIVALIVTKRWKHDSKGHMSSLLLSLLLGIFGIIIFSVAMIDRIGPILMKLPHHHCPYCLLQYVPASIGFTGLALIGNFSLGWAFIAGTIGRVKETRTHLSQYVRRLWFFAWVSLLASWLIVIICLQWIK